MLLLQELLKDWPCTITGSKFRVQVSGVTEYSKNVKPNYIFVARKGAKEDGLRFIGEAVQKGAAAIIVDRNMHEEIELSIPVITVPDCQKFISHASAVFSGKPSERLTVIAITGTNGKTTVSHFIGQLLTDLGEKVAVIGTTGIFIDQKKIDFEAPELTTLPAEYLHPLLRHCEKQGVTHIVLEASSLGLVAHRLDHCEIDIGILLNISKDHYDEHGGKESYIHAKKILLEMAKEMLVNCDDEECMMLAKKVQRSYTYFGTNEEAHIRLKKQDWESSIQNEKMNLPLSLIGHYNHMNALAAISALNRLAYEIPTILKHTQNLVLPEGRMEQLKGDGFSVIIDYAHTPDALKAILYALKKVCKGRLITVFGCGGDRDKGKRGEMGKIASTYSSIVFVTSDNPRKENPLKIIASIIEGMDQNETHIEIEHSRANAIQKAISCGQKDDIIVIAGKGHEKTQQIGNETMLFSDRNEVIKALAKKKKIN